MQNKHWCKIHGFTEFYKNGKQSYCKECYNEKRKAKRNELKKRAVAALGGKCQCCGYDLYRDWETDRKSTRLNSSHITRYRMPSSA